MPSIDRDTELVARGGLTRMQRWIRWFEEKSKLSVALRVTVDRLKDSFWMVPALMAAAGLFLGVVMPFIDGFVDIERGEGPLGFLFFTGSDGARSQLSSIAGSSITVVATVFSITIATLTLTSNQFGPRLLRTFVSDTGVKVAMGTFVMTFLYAILLLRTVQNPSDDKDGFEGFVPHLSLLLATLMAVGAVAVLIYFVHHVAIMIRAPQVIATVGDELDAVLDRFIPTDGSQGDFEAEQVQAADPLAVTRIGQGAQRLHSLVLDQEVESGVSRRLEGSVEHDGPAEDGNGRTSEGRQLECEPSDEVVVLRAKSCGFVTYLDERGFIKPAKKHGCVILCETTAGNYVYANTPLLRAVPDGFTAVDGRPADERLDALRADLQDKADRTIGISSRRTLADDPIFGINQLTEIAQRAMSPGINDPFTAQNCVQRLGAALSRIAARPMPGVFLRDDDAKVRVVRQPIEWSFLVRASVEPIRRYGGGDAAVVSSLIEMLAKVAEACPWRDRRAVLLQEALHVGDVAMGDASTLADIEREMIRRTLVRFKETVAARDD